MSKTTFLYALIKKDNLEFVLSQLAEELKIKNVPSHDFENVSILQFIGSQDQIEEILKFFIVLRDLHYAYPVGISCLLMDEKGFI